MNKKVGIKFKSTGKVYDFSCGVFVLAPDDHVIVETEQGLGMGTVAVAPIRVTPRERTKRRSSSVRTPPAALIWTFGGQCLRMSLR